MSEEQEIPKDTSTKSLITEISEVLDQHFEPNERLDATEGDYKTTAEIGEMIDSHMGEKVERSIIREALVMAGFNSKLIGTKFYWLMRRKR